MWLWRLVATLPDASPFAAVTTTIACMTFVPPDIRSAVLQAVDRASFWMALVGVVATAAHPEDFRAIEAAVKDQGGVSVQPAWAQATTQQAWVPLLCPRRPRARPCARARPLGQPPPAPRSPRTAQGTPCTSRHTRCPGQQPRPRPLAPQPAPW